MSKAAALITVPGRLTRNPEVRKNSGTDKEFVSVGVAENYTKWDGSDGVTFWELTASGKAGEGLMQLEKGNTLIAVGTPGVRARLAEKDGEPVAYADLTLKVEDFGPSGVFADITVNANSRGDNRGDNSADEVAPKAAKGNGNGSGRKF